MDNFAAVDAPEEEDEIGMEYGDDDRDELEDGPAGLYENGRKSDGTLGSKAGKAKGKAAVGKDLDRLGQSSGKPAAQLRRDQNRVAQREFRQRKQIRDLEAQIQILSGDRDERQDLMSLLVRNLLKENAQLRKMIKDLSAFIGEGLATCLPRLGLTMDGMEAFVNQAETETAHEAYAALKSVRDAEIAGEGNGGPSQRKEPAAWTRGSDQVAGSGSRASEKSMGGRAAGSGGGGERVDPRDLHSVSPQEVPAGGLSRKRKATSAGIDAEVARTTSRRPSGTRRRSNNFDESPAPVDEAIRGDPLSDRLGMQAGHPPLRPSRVTPSQSNGTIDSTLDSTRLRPNSIPPNLAALVDAASLTAISYNIEYDVVSRTEAPCDDSPTSLPCHGRLSDHIAATSASHPSHRGAGEHSGSAIPSSTSNKVDIPGEKLPEIQAALNNAPERLQMACQLIAYQLSNYQNSPSYHLPPPLRPTHIQRTIPHEHLIDGLIFPSLRDRMIMVRGRYDILKASQSIMTEWTIPGEDILDQNSWEVSEKWFKDNPLLMDPDVIAIANRWRISRGQEIMTRESLTGTSGAEEQEE